MNRKQRRAKEKVKVKSVEIKPYDLLENSNVMFSCRCGESFNVI